MNYKPILKEHFLRNVEELLTGNINDESFPDNISKSLASDFCKINFNIDKHNKFNRTKPYKKYPVGYEELNKDFHIFWMVANDYKKYPIAFIFYWNDELRAYIPTEGNVWNKKTNQVYIKNEINKDELDKLISKEKMVEEILINFKNN